MEREGRQTGDEPSLDLRRQGDDALAGRVKIHFVGGDCRNRYPELISGRATRRMLRRVGLRDVLTSRARGDRGAIPEGLRGLRRPDDPWIRRRGGSHLRSELRDVAVAGAGRSGRAKGGFAGHLLPGRGRRIRVVPDSRGGRGDRGGLDGPRRQARAAPSAGRGPLDSSRGRVTLLCDPCPAGPGRSGILSREASCNAERGAILLRGSRGAGDDFDPAGRDSPDGGGGRRHHGVRDCCQRRTSEGKDRVRGPAAARVSIGTTVVRCWPVVLTMTKSLLRVHSLGGRGPTCPTTSRVWVSAARRRKASGGCTSTPELPLWSS